MALAVADPDMQSEATCEIAGDGRHHTVPIPHTAFTHARLYVAGGSVLHLDGGMLDGHLSTYCVRLHQNRLRIISLEERDGGGSEGRKQGINTAMVKKTCREMLLI